MTLLAFLACRSVEPTLPVQVDPPTPGTPPTPVRALFDELQDGADIAVDLDPVAVELLQEWPREYVDGQVRIADEIFEARIRLKGNGSFQPIDARPSLKIKLEDSPFHLHTFVLNNGTSDPSRSHELLARTGFELLDLPVARALPVWVEVAGTNRGAYTLVEDVDEVWLERGFDSDDTLYELFDGDFQRGMLEGFTLEEGSARPEVLLAISDDLALGDVAGFDFAMDHFDRAQFFDFWAATALFGQTDAYPYSRPGDDVYVHIDQDGLVTLVPHGLDEAFLPRGRQIADTAGLLARRCLALVACRDEFGHAVTETRDRLRDAGFDQVLLDEADAADLRWEDARFVTPITDDDRDHLHELRAWLDQRHDQLQVELTP